MTTETQTTGSPNAPRKPGRATLASIAADVGVSVASVSKVLNGRSGVSDSTRRRIEELLHQRGYTPRGASAYANVVELVFFELDSEWLLEVLKGVEAAASQAGYRIMLTPSQSLSRTGQDWVDEVIQRRPAGIVLVFSGPEPEQAMQLQSRGIPFVVVDPASEPGPGVPYVGAQNWAGGLAATEHLIGLGHTRVAVVTGPPEQSCSRARLAGFTSAMQEAGLTVPPEYVREGRFHYDDGLEQGRILFALPTPPTAIFACADLQALGIYEAAAEAGLRIPQDVSVVGFDDLLLARWAGPPLTTIHQPIYDMAEIATRMVVDPQRSSQRRIDLATGLVVRQSTGPAPTDRPGGTQHA